MAEGDEDEIEANCWYEPERKRQKRPKVIRAPRTYPSPSSNSTSSPDSQVPHRRQQVHKEGPKTTASSSSSSSANQAPTPSSSSSSVHKQRRKQRRDRTLTTSSTSSTNLTFEQPERSKRVGSLPPPSLTVESAIFIRNQVRQNELRHFQNICDLSIQPFDNPSLHQLSPTYRPRASSAPPTISLTTYPTDTHGSLPLGLPAYNHPSTFALTQRLTNQLIQAHTRRRERKYPRAPIYPGIDPRRPDIERIILVTGHNNSTFIGDKDNNGIRRRPTLPPKSSGHEDVIWQGRETELRMPVNLSARQRAVHQRLHADGRQRRVEGRYIWDEKEEKWRWRESGRSLYEADLGTWAAGSRDERWVDFGMVARNLKEKEQESKSPKPE